MAKQQGEAVSSASPPVIARVVQTSEAPNRWEHKVSDRPTLTGHETHPRPRHEPNAIMFGKLKGKFDHRDDLGSQPTHSSEQLQPQPQHDDRKHHRAASSSSSTKKEAPPEVNIAPAFRTNFACVSLHMSDRIRLMQFPPEVCDAVRNSLRQSWPMGIQGEREYYGSLEFKMKGYPWSPAGEDAIHARRLTRGIMATLYSYGWILYISSDVSMKQGDKDNLFFRHQEPAPAPCEWFSCTFSRGDRLRLIDAPQAVVDDVIAVLSLHTQSHEPYKVGGVYEIKFNGYPFMASGGDTMVSRMMVLQMFAVFEQHGYTVYASIDQKYGGEHGTECDSWHLSRNANWQPGAPVYHQ